MRPRIALFAVAACAGSIARAETPGATVRIARVEACFGSERLAARIHEQAPEVKVEVGAAPGEGLVVEVRRRGRGLEVRLRRGAQAGTPGSERRRIPASADCPAVLDAVALMVVRAAFPVGSFAPPPALPAGPETRPADRPPFRGTPAPPAHADGPAEDRASSPPAPAPPSRPDRSADRASSPQSAPAPGPQAPLTDEKRPSTELAAKPSATTPTPAGAPASSDERVPPSGPPRAESPARPPRLQIGAAVRLAVALDGGTVAPGGSAELALRLSRVVIAVDGGVDAEQHATSGGIDVAMRRFPLGLSGGYEQPLRRGVLRFSAGALLELWTAASRGLAHPAAALVAHPGLVTTIAFRISPVRRLDLFAGLRLEYATVAESFAVGGVGTVVTTPSLWLGLSTGAALNLL